MKIFLDSADINEIKTYIDTGFVDGVTTNPSLIAKSGRNILDAISERIAWHFLGSPLRLHRWASGWPLQRLWAHFGLPCSLRSGVSLR